MSITLKLAEPFDMEWVNETYDSIKFKPSDLSKEKIVIAIMNDSHKAGLGRLIQLNSNGHWELGGILVLEEYRKQGIARRIVQKVVDLAVEMKVDHLWCIPFQHLVPFYQSCGLLQFPKDSKDVPCEIRCKIGGCCSTFPDKPVDLLKLSQR